MRTITMRAITMGAITMGCDIHMHVECNKSFGCIKQWFCCDYWTIDPSDGEYTIIPLYDCRYYRLFSVLADVRNNSNNVPTKRIAY